MRNLDTIKFFEKELKDILKVNHCFLVSSGTSALCITLQALMDLSRKTEVIMPAYTCPSVLAAVIKSGLKPVLCDLAVNSSTLDFNELNSKVTDNTLAIITVHLFGILEDTQRINHLTASRNIFHIEDSAQILASMPEASNTKGNNQRIPGTTGDVGIFSFGRGKPLTLLHGGAIITNHDSIAKVLSKKTSELERMNTIEVFIIMLKSVLYSLFFYPRLYYLLQYFPFLNLGKTIFNLNFKTKKLDSFTAALGSITIKNIKQINSMRVHIEHLYNSKLTHFQNYFLKDDHRGMPHLRLPLLYRNKCERDSVLFQINRRGLGATGMYPDSLNVLKDTKSYFNGIGYYANAQSFAERIITLPLHSYVTEKDINTINNVMERIIH